MLVPMLAVILFAQVPETSGMPTQAGTRMPTLAEVWIGPIMTTALSLAGIVMNWLQSRDKLRYDTKQLTLETKVAELSGDVDECRKDRDRIRQEYRAEKDELKQEIGALRDRIDNRNASQHPKSPAA